MITVRLATPSDADAIAEVHLASWDAAFRSFLPELVEQRGDQTAQRKKQWADAFTRDDSSFVYLAVEQGHIIGFAQGGYARQRYELGQNYDGELWRLYILPDAQAKGIGRRLVSQVADHLAGMHCSNMIVTVYAMNTSARQFYEHLGAQHLGNIPLQEGDITTTQSVYGWDDITPLLSKKALVRPAALADADAISRVHVASWQTTYRGLLPDSLLDRLDKTVERRKAYWADTITNNDDEQAVFVGQVGDEIVAFACCGADREKHFPGYTGEIQAIYALEKAQGIGLGKALMRAQANWLLDHDHRAAMLWVIAGNKTIGFYEHLGGQKIGQKQAEIGGQRVIELAYGWSRIKTLLGRGTYHDTSSTSQG